MRALVKYARGKGLVEIREVPVPEPPPGWVQIQVQAVAICGSDIHIRDDAHPYWPPITMGHEFSGVISKLGEGVEGWEVGQRVVSETRTGSCGVCQLCQTGCSHVCPHKRPPGIGINGAMSDYLVMPARLLHSIPENVSFDQAALMEPTACCIHGLLERVTVMPGDLVVIQGPGPIGIISLLLARIAGARAVVVSGTSRSARHRLPIASQCGADVIVDISKESLGEAVLDLSDGEGADVVFETSGSPAAIADVLRIVRRCGRIGAIGIVGGVDVPVPWGHHPPLPSGRVAAGLRNHGQERRAEGAHLSGCGRQGLTPWTGPPTYSSRCLKWWRELQFSCLKDLIDLAVEAVCAHKQMGLPVAVDLLIFGQQLQCPHQWRLLLDKQPLDVIPVQSSLHTCPEFAPSQPSAYWLVRSPGTVLPHANQRGHP